jgi:hypothetical protein
MRALVPVAAAMLFPLAASAQVKLEVMPYFTSYYATALTAKPAPDTTERQEAGPGLGAIVTYRFNNIIGVQGSFTYVFSGIIPKYPPATGLVSNSNQPLPGRISFTTLRATLQPRRSNYFLAAGLGIVQRSGKAWDVPGLDHLSSTVASLGFGIRARVTPSFAFNIGVDGNFYFSDPDGEEQAGGVGHYYQRRLQRDVLVSIGVPYALLGR